MRPLLVAAVATAVALLAVPLAGSAARPSPAGLIQKGLSAAVERGDLSPTEAAGYRATLANVQARSKRLPPLRTELLQAVVGDVAAQWRAYTAPRALTLFSTLTMNAEWLASHALTGPHPDIEGDDGAVYRFFSDHGYVFHPLANFAKLNAEVAAKDDAATAHLASALVARAVAVGRSMVWEYDFPFAAGRAPWTSGMAQAVAAQALARAGTLLSDQNLLDTADAAYAAVPRLLSPSSPAKPWVALYSFDRVPVLNAQLQAALSVGDYASIAGNTAATAMAARLTTAARALLPKFDTGYWSLYSLRGDESPLDYHDYVIGLLRKLATRTGEAVWQNTAVRFQGYESEPPVIRLRGAPPTVYPRPADGFLDDAPIRFWLSKASTVTMTGGREARHAVVPPRREHVRLVAGLRRSRNVSALPDRRRACRDARGAGRAGGHRRRRPGPSAAGGDRDCAVHRLVELGRGGDAVAAPPSPAEPGGIDAGARPRSPGLRGHAAAEASSGPLARDDARVELGRPHPGGLARVPAPMKALVALALAAAVLALPAEAGNRLRPVPILMYHVLSPPPANAAYPELYVAPAAFRAEVAWLAAHGYRAVTLQRVFDAWRGAATLPPKPVVLTFDDGYLSDVQDCVARAEGPALARRAQPRGREPEAGLGDPAAGSTETARRRLGARRAHAHATPT